jgi:hypothetical protein
VGVGLDKPPRKGNKVLEHRTPVNGQGGAN